MISLVLHSTLAPPQSHVICNSNGIILIPGYNYNIHTYIRILSRYVSANLVLIKLLNTLVTEETCIRSYGNLMVI